MYISVSCFTRYESFAKSSLKIASEQKLFIPRGCQILAPKRSLAFLGFSGFSLSRSWRLKAIRGSHAPAVRHLSLHLFPSSSSSSSSTSLWLYSLSLLLRARVIPLHSPDQLGSRAIGLTVKETRTGGNKRARDRSSEMIFLTSRHCYLLHTQSQRDKKRERKNLHYINRKLLSFSFII